MKKLYLFFVCSLCCFCVLLAKHVVKHNEVKESFVIEKKTNTKRSRAKMQEELCTLWADQLSCEVEMYKIIAEVQDIQIKQTREYLENSKNGFISKAKKDALDVSIALSKKYEETVTVFLKETHSYLEHLRSL